MRLDTVYRLVALGRLSIPSGHSWKCPVCLKPMGVLASQDERDRRALDHCLEHARVLTVSRACPVRASASYSL